MSTHRRACQSVNVTVECQALRSGREGRRESRSRQADTNGKRVQNRRYAMTNAPLSSKRHNTSPCNIKFKATLLLYRPSSVL